MCRNRYIHIKKKTECGNSLWYERYTMEPYNTADYPQERLSSGCRFSLCVCLSMVFFHTYIQSHWKKRSILKTKKKAEDERRNNQQRIAMAGRLDESMRENSYDRAILTVTTARKNQFVINYGSVIENHTWIALIVRRISSFV